MRMQVFHLTLFLAAYASTLSISFGAQHANTTLAVSKLTAAVQSTNFSNAQKAVSQKPVDVTNLLRRAFASASTGHNAAKSEAADARVESARKYASEIHAQVAQAQAVANAQIKLALSKESANASVAGMKAAKIGGQKVSKIEKSIEVIQSEIREKEKELKIQSGLVDEKQKDDATARKEHAELKLKADNLRKEAEVAVELAKEKSDAFAKADKEEKAGELKEKNLEAEAAETQKFLKQTQAEEKQLNEKLVNLIKEQNDENIPKKEVHKAQKITSKTSSFDQTKKTKLGGPASGVASPSRLNPSVSASLSEKAPELDAAAVRKLLEENKRLKAEKEELVSELKQKKTISEKARLKQKLKARLLNIDRHVVMKKTKK